MKFQHLAAAVLATAVAPVVLLAPPAFAGPAAEPIAAVQPEAGDKPTVEKKLPAVPLTLTSDTSVVPGQWLELRLDLSNPDPGELSGMRLFFVTGTNMHVPPEKDIEGTIRFEQRTESGSWKSLERKPGRDNFNEFSLDVPTMPQGGKVSIQLRLRYEAWLLTDKAVSGFIYPGVANPGPDREPDRYPFHHWKWTLPTPSPKPTPSKTESGKPDTDKPKPKPTRTPAPPKPSGTPSTHPAPDGGSKPTSTAHTTGAPATAGDTGNSGGNLAATGTGGVLPWAAGTGAIAVALGTGLFLKTRDRRTRTH
ncbi:hypothetical protein [Streptomyces crystallinus]|uniref:Uncharacterized protein n=1 Tax=Streptomyces crystallinus TaxID=68191 RepID=A0ABP3RYV4_9ACTN